MMERRRQRRSPVYSLSSEHGDDGHRQADGADPRLQPLHWGKESQA